MCRTSATKNHVALHTPAVCRTSATTNEYQRPVRRAVLACHKLWASTRPQRAGKSNTSKSTARLTSSMNTSTVRLHAPPQRSACGVAAVNLLCSSSMVAGETCVLQQRRGISTGLAGVRAGKQHWIPAGQQHRLTRATYARPCEIGVQTSSTELSRSVLFDCIQQRLPHWPRARCEAAGFVEDRMRKTWREL